MCISIVSMETCPPHTAWLGLRGEFPMAMAHLLALNVSPKLCER